MKKKIILTLGIILGVLFLSLAIMTGCRYHEKAAHRDLAEKAALTFSNLDHDIYISDDSLHLICNEKITGWNPTVGPSPAGWPMAFPYEWEVLLAESPHFYFARLIYHEYVLWWSFDYPYLLCKIPKLRTSADWATNTAARLNALWDVTNQFEHGWNAPKCINGPQIYNINGHGVSFAHDTFRYERYVVVHDCDYPW